MIIGLDLDGCVFDYIRGLSDAIAEQDGVTDMEAHRLAYGEAVDYNMSNWPGFPGEFKRRHTTAVDAGLYSTLPVIPGASETLWKLSDEGHHIRIITSRFVQHGQNSKVVQTTGESLDKNNIPYRDILFLSSKWDVSCDVFIDDSPSNIEKLRAAGKEVIIFDASYNRHLPGRRARTWDEAYANLQEIQAIRSYL